MSRWARPFAAALAVLATAGPVRAHDFWIEPASYAPKVGEPLALRLLVGDHFAGEEYPREARHCARFEVLGPKEPLPVAGEELESPAGTVTLAEPGLHWAVYRSRDSVARVPPEVFAAYLAEEGHVGLLEAWQASRPDAKTPVKEAFSRCSKALLHAGGGEAARAPKAAGFDRVAKLKLEIVPEANPLSLKPGEALPVRLWWDGQPLADRQVAALSAAEPKQPVKVRTDADGRARLVLPRAGVWLVKSVHVEKAGLDDTVQYRSVWAALTFEMPAPPPAPAPTK